MPIFDDEDSINALIGTKKTIEGVTYIKFSNGNLWARIIEYPWKIEGNAEPWECLLSKKAWESILSKKVH